MYKFDIHCHCAEGSTCAKVPVRDLVRAYKKAGFDGMVLTDHFYARTAAMHGDYKAGIENQWQTYLTAKAEGEACGITVLFGFEYRWNVYDFLVYGLGPDFMLANPDMFSVPFAEFARRVHDCGGFIIQPHPFRHLKAPIYIPVDDVDAIEICNGSHSDVNSPYPAFYNDLAEHFAREMKLIGTGGSDTHRITEDGQPNRYAAMLFEKKIETIDDLILQIKNRQFTIEKEPIA
jgi:predicted metal-dependent phosphoesterase TrpH